MIFAGRCNGEWAVCSGSDQTTWSLMANACDLIIELGSELVVKNIYGATGIPRGEVIDDIMWSHIILSATNIG